ncbi:MAG: hypothetical protein U9Q61_06395 [Thermodesulfobacteriota bacterium]|nr:hypothetical protein [Thermodesulfobacteriota bacterium]
MDILLIFACLIILAAFGLMNFRYNKQKGNALVDDFKRFIKQ